MSRDYANDKSVKSCDKRLEKSLNTKSVLAMEAWLDKREQEKGKKK